MVVHKIVCFSRAQKRLEIKSELLKCNPPFRQALIAGIYHILLNKHFYGCLIWLGNEMPQKYLNFQ